MFNSPLPRLKGGGSVLIMLVTIVGHGGCHDSPPTLCLTRAYPSVSSVALGAQGRGDTSPRGSAAQTAHFYVRSPGYNVLGNCRPDLTWRTSVFSHQIPRTASELAGRPPEGAEAQRRGAA